MQDKPFIPALGYNFLTNYYDLTIRLTMPEQRFRETLIKEIEPQTNEKILEFGFGTGQNLIRVKTQNPSIQLSGLDIDPNVKAITEHKLTNQQLEVTLDLYDGGKFPYPDAQFDKVYSCLVFHQLDADTKRFCLKEIYRVLKPTGTLIIADWGKAQNLLMRFTFGIVQLLDGFKTTDDNVKGLMPKFISEVGFREVSVSQSMNTAIGTFSYFKATKR
jgi:ubiquinone/menaquinone biosynthesis C-methylase UbiE